jgi:hypothetical protein
LFLTWTSCKNWKHPEMKIQKGIRKWNQKGKFVSIQTVIGWIDLARSGEKQKKEIRRKDMNSEFRFWGEIVVATIIILNEWIFLNWSLMRLNQSDDGYYLRWDIINCLIRIITNVYILFFSFENNNYIFNNSEIIFRDFKKYWNSWPKIKKYWFFLTRKMDFINTASPNQHKVCQREPQKFTST